TVAASARPARRTRVVATVREAVIQTQLEAARDDLRFAHLDEGRVETKPGALDAGAGRDVRERLERAREFGPAVRIAGIVERVDADDEIVRPDDFGPSEGEGEKDRIARRNIGRRDPGGVQ